MARSRGSGSAAGLARIRQGRSGSTVRTVRPAAGMERRLDARDEGGRLGAGTASGCPEQGPMCATRSRDQRVRRGVGATRARHRIWKVTSAAMIQATSEGTTPCLEGNHTLIIWAGQPIAWRVHGGGYTLTQCQKNSMPRRNCMAWATKIRLPLAFIKHFCLHVGHQKVVCEGRGLVPYSINSGLLFAHGLFWSKLA